MCANAFVYASACGGRVRHDEAQRDVVRGSIQRSVSLGAAVLLPAEHQVRTAFTEPGTPVRSSLSMKYSGVLSDQNTGVFAQVRE